jgi:hypothetical protein
MILTLWTDDVGLAQAAERAGVDRIGPDLEQLGKAARQPEPDAWCSDHRAASLPALHRALGRATLFVRTNPLHRGFVRELEEYVDAGVRCLMLPMVRSVAHVRVACNAVRGRAEIVVMIEHADALSHLDELVAQEGVTEIYVGCNDLARSMTLPSRFAVLASDLPARIAERTLRRGLRFGIFGLALPGDDTLPIPSDLVYAEQIRLGATSFVLARSFRASVATLVANVAAARSALAEWVAQPSERLAGSRTELVRRCNSLSYPPLPVDPGRALEVEHGLSARRQS